MAYGSLGMHENAQAIVKSSIFPGFDSDQCFHFHWSFNVIRSALKSAKKVHFLILLIVSIICITVFFFNYLLNSTICVILLELCVPLYLFYFCFLQFINMIFFLKIDGLTSQVKKKLYYFYRSKKFQFLMGFLKFDI